MNIKKKYKYKSEIQPILEVTNFRNIVINEQS